MVEALGVDDHDMDHLESGKPLPQFLRLSFATHREFAAYLHENLQLLTDIWLWHESLGNHPHRVDLSGICSTCNLQTTFSSMPMKATGEDRFEYRVEWWSQSACEHCRLSTLERTVLLVFFESHEASHRVYHVGHYSGFRKWLSGRVRNLASSQFEEGRTPGEVEGDVRFEDLTRLSFENGEFDSVICMEILEHIPDYRAALREMARTLVPGGKAILSFPWLGRDSYDHRTRAELLADGTIRHILPPEFHGDSATQEGILSFRDFGWKILDDLREAGFSAASAEFVYGPLYGFMTLLNPVIVGIK